MGGRSVNPSPHLHRGVSPPTTIHSKSAGNLFFNVTFSLFPIVWQLMNESNLDCVMAGCIGRPGMISGVGFLGYMIGNRG